MSVRSIAASRAASLAWSGARSADGSDTGLLAQDGIDELAGFEAREIELVHEHDSGLFESPVGDGGAQWDREIAIVGQ